MKPLKDQIAELRKAGYGLPAAQMKAAHDVLLLADARVNWLQLNPETVTAAVLAFLRAKL